MIDLVLSIVIPAVLLLALGTDLVVLVTWVLRSCGRRLR
jgi:hypothetical protein